MKRHLGYVVYSALLLIAMAWGVARGGLWTPADELQGVPRSVRDNPGVYRSTYSGYHRYSGGK